MRTNSRLFALLMLASSTIGSSQLRAADSPEGIRFFEEKVRPVLIKYCYECHSAAIAEPKGGLRIDSREAVRKGGETGPAVVPGQVEKSLLVEAVRHESLEMPPGKRLAPEIIADLVKWIELGAPDPRDRPPSADEAATLAWKVIAAERRLWWSFQPLGQSPVPTVEANDWSQQPIDRFVLAGLHGAGLKPTSRATAQVLLRRLAFVLTGLPPKPEQVAEIEQANPSDFERTIDRIAVNFLASPHFGERFARHWMDVVRYGDTYGYEWDIPARGAWQYRDYLTRVFNADVGFDQLIREQIAGDLLPDPRINSALQFNESLIGPQFFHLGEHRHGTSLAFNGIHQDMVNNKIEAFSKAFLATTVACARCHDHKLDAVSQRDYYALASVFMTPRWDVRAVDAPERNAAAIARLKELRAEIRGELAKTWSQQSSQWADELASALRPAGSGATVPPPAASEAWIAAFALPNQEMEKDKSPTLDAIADLGPLIQSTLADEHSLAASWRALAKQWRDLHAARHETNQKQFHWLTDFSSPELPPGWSVEGDGMAHGFTPEGTPLVALGGDAAVQRLLPRGYHTHALSPRLPGALRSSRLQTYDKNSVSVLVAGGDWGATQTIHGNAFLNTSIDYLKTAIPEWKKFSTYRTTKPVEWTGRLSLVTAALNVNFPGPTYFLKGKFDPKEEGYDQNGWFGVSGIVLHAGAALPQDPLPHWAGLFHGDAPQDSAQAWRRVGQWLSDATQRWAAGDLNPGDVTLLNWLIEKKLLRTEFPDSARLKNLVAEYRRVERTIAPPRGVISMDERGMPPADYRLDIRGNVDEPGEIVPHDFLEVFSGQNDVSASPSSGRLELAEFMASPRCPLTARVYVNRVWQWLFGTGLVNTSDDFGHLGEKPSHPELLDYLALQFIADGWSTKKLIRSIVQSRTFQQSGEVDPQARERDPLNRLLHHYPTRRLEAEAIRDGILAVSGRLDPQLYGPPIDPPRAKEDDTKRLFSGPLDGLGRRSIYTKITLMEPPKLLSCFNMPDPKIPTGKRDVTNVPTQALALLNDPFVLGQAEFWAGELIKQPHHTVAERVQAMFVQALGRKPDDMEIDRWSRAVREFASTGQSKESELLNDRVAWMQTAHAFFNTKEFIYYR